MALEALGLLGGVKNGGNWLRKKNPIGLISPICLIGLISYPDEY